MTQKKLAVMTGVSTSMINQIESGRCKPSYNTAKKIFESLAKLEGQTSTRKAGDICSEKIVRLAPNNTVREAGKKMHEKTIDQDFEFPENALSQLTRISGCVLVEKNSKIIGIITSSDLLKMM